MTYKDEALRLRKDNEELKIKLNAKEQIISVLYNLIKDLIFWNKS